MKKEPLGWDSNPRHSAFHVTEPNHAKQNCTLVQCMYVYRVIYQLLGILKTTVIFLFCCRNISDTTCGLKFCYSNINLLYNEKIRSKIIYPFRIHIKTHAYHTCDCTVLFTWCSYVSVSGAVSIELDLHCHLDLINFGTPHSYTLLELNV